MQKNPDDIICLFYFFKLKKAHSRAKEDIILFPRAGQYFHEKQTELQG